MRLYYMNVGGLVDGLICRLHFYGLAVGGACGITERRGAEGGGLRVCSRGGGV